MNFFLLALKNLRRHPGHTVLKATGIGAATAVIGLWGMLTGGFADELQRTATEVELGMVQVHHSDYLKAPNIYDTVAFTPEMNAALENRGIFAAPRLYGFALAGAGDQSIGVRIRGLVPGLEKKVTTIHNHLAAGAWLTEGDTGAVIIGGGLAKMLSVEPGHEIVLVGQAADGSLANNLFRIKGVLKTINQEFDRRTIIVTEAAFRDFYVVESGVHEIAFSSDAIRGAGAGPGNVKASVMSVFQNYQSAVPASVQTWREIKPTLARTLDMLKVTSLFSLVFTYIALGCLVVNSIMMMVYDRMREYGVMKAVGTEPFLIIKLILSEAWWLGLLAAGIAVVVAAPFAWHWHTQGFDLSFYIERVSFGGFIIEPRIFARIGTRQVLLPLIFLLLTMPLAALYPAWKASKVEPIEALNSQT